MAPIATSVPLKISLAVCILGMLGLGIFPSAAVRWASEAISVLQVGLGG